LSKCERLELPQPYCYSNYGVVWQCLPNTKDHDLPVPLPGCLPNSSDAWVWHTATASVPIHDLDPASAVIVRDSTQQLLCCRPGTSRSTKRTSTGTVYTACARRWSLECRYGTAFVDTRYAAGTIRIRSDADSASHEGNVGQETTNGTCSIWYAFYDSISTVYDSTTTA
jgi:hypothetical protein